MFNIRSNYCLNKLDDLDISYKVFRFFSTFGHVEQTAAKTTQCFQQETKKILVNVPLKLPPNWAAIFLTTSEDIVAALTSNVTATYRVTYSKYR